MRSLTKFLLALFFSTLCFSMLSPVVKADADSDAAADADTPEAVEADEEEEDVADETEEDDEEEEEDDDEEEDEIGPSDDVDTAFIFPELHPDNELPIGGAVTLLVSMTNKGEEDFIVTHIGAHLISPYDSSYFIQNFTVRELDESVGSDQQATFGYYFRPDANLDAHSFRVAAWIQYNDTDELVYRSTVFNTTLELVEPPSDFDAMQFFTYVSIFAVIGLVIYVIYNAVAPNKGQGMEHGTREEEVEIYKPRSTSRSVRRRRTKSRK